MADDFYAKLMKKKRASDIVMITLRQRDGKEIIFHDKSVCPNCGAKLVKEKESDNE